MIYTEATMRFFDRNLLEGAQSFDAVGPDYLYTGMAALYVCWSLCSDMLLKSQTLMWLVSHHMVVWGDTQFTVFFCLFFCLFFVCSITDFSAAEKARGVKLCMRVELLSGQVFSHFGED